MDAILYMFVSGAGSRTCLESPSDRRRFGKPLVFRGGAGFQAQDKANCRLSRTLSKVASKLADPRRSKTSCNEEEMSPRGPALMARCTATSSAA